MEIRGLVTVVGAAPEIRDALATDGYEVRTVDGLDALEVRATSQVVVVSGPLPDAGVGHVGAMIIAAVEAEDEVTVALQRGAHDVVRVPIVAADLIARVRAAARTAALHDQVRSVGRTDPLTALANRHTLDEHLAKACSLARRLRTPLSLLLIDIDRTRRINDELGRAAGDLVLAEVARRVMHGLRGEDVAGRWSGDQFIVVLPSTPVDGAWRLADRIRTSVCDEPILLPPGDPADVLATVSIGCAEGGGGDLEEHLRRTQAALDDAQSGGGNKVIAG